MRIMSYGLDEEGPQGLHQRMYESNGYPVGATAIIRRPSRSSDTRSPGSGSISWLRPAGPQAVVADRTGVILAAGNTIRVFL